MGRFPFGPFAFVRLDERMKDKPEWKEALEKNPNVDPMGQLPGQPHVECAFLSFLFVPFPAFCSREDLAKPYSLSPWPWRSIIRDARRVTC